MTRVVCTLIVAHRVFAGWPLVVAANRDEKLDRPATSIRRWTAEEAGEEAGFLAPRDEVAKGTWLGVTPHGMFVGVTNRFGAPVDAARASRGQLVVEALRAPSATELHARLARLSPLRFNAFHLLYADASAAFVTWSDGAVLRQSELAPGLHVVTERSLGGDDSSRTELIERHWSQLRARSRTAAPPSVEELKALLSVHGGDNPVGGTCVHYPSFGYGTRSSLVLLLAQQREESRMAWAEGHPCLATFREENALLRGLLTEQA